jgi:predicted ferric reductase
MSETVRQPVVGTAARPAGRLRRLFGYPVLAAVFASNAALIAALWVRHGHLDDTSSPGSILMAVGQLCALIGTYLALVGIVFVARIPYLEHMLGDGLARLHRILGMSAITLIAAHIAFTVGGYALADSVGLSDEFVSEVVTYPYMLAALVGFGLFLVVGLSSVKFIRSRLSYETWSGLHLYAYLAILLAFGHQLAVGSDFSIHFLSRFYWVAMFVAVFAAAILFRVIAPIAVLMRHRFRVDRVVVETSDVVSIYIAGRRLERLNARAGQYFRLRLVARNEWWRSHPFSVSAMPDGDSLRFTVKALGDFSERLQSLRPGTRVLLEGPYGALTSTMRTTENVALIGAGIGVTPLRALFEELAGAVDVRLIYRASRPQDIVFWDELNQIQRRPRAYLTFLIGRRGSPGLRRDPLSAASLKILVPDIQTRDIFVCGPTRMMEAVERSLRELGVPRWRVHTERFAA